MEGNKYFIKKKNIEKDQKQPSKKNDKDLERKWKMCTLLGVLGEETFFETIKYVQKGF